jgi:hypothetical protein
MHTSLSRLRAFYADFTPPLLLNAIILREFPATVAILTDFNAGSEALLKMAAEINSAIPVISIADDAAYTQAIPRCHRLGFQTILQPGTMLADTIETLGILALLTGRPAGERIELDDHGVFHIHPFAAPALMVDSGGWSV